MNKTDHDYAAGDAMRLKQQLMRDGNSWPVRGLYIAVGAAIPFSSVHAYVGPGLGLGTLVVILGVIGSVFLALFGVIWYPIKRMLKKRRTLGESDGQEDNNEPIEPGDRETTEP
jgi:Flp pilus assembly protein TadB